MELYDAEVVGWVRGWGGGGGGNSTIQCVTVIRHRYSFTFYVMVLITTIRSNRTSVPEGCFRQLIPKVVL